ncbi:MAG: VOC family protein, partial [Actinomycetota bacterium]|nr:VOC family protein [Actinomycetota bacterium]
MRRLGEQPTEEREIPSSRATPYLTVHDGPAALEFYAAAFGAVEMMRVVMDEATGQLGHAEFRIGETAFFLSDEFAEMGVISPRTLAGTAIAIHLDVDDVDDVFAAAVAAGAEMLSPPADQPHGARHGAVVDPFGHRWMISQQIERVGRADYETRMRDLGLVVTGSP